MLATPSSASAGKEKRKLFEKAARRHVALAKEAGAGQGIDRHLLGLRQLLPSPSSSSAADGFATAAQLFSDPLVKRSAHWTLSTSALFSRHFAAYGFGEVVVDGYGVPYITGFDDYLMFTVTSLAAMPNAEFSDAIRAAGEEVYGLFTSKEAVAERRAKAKL
ncbi:CoA-dependent acyltransferase [Athelia psychrophila]|uniref:CoA-dependent acyltransferase n=1 Tax=Athelia psychrophila TaxID=1759441 RepID=A0A166F9N2_9AGAM|nr:CoA-dependent acyltransferase [Fibularhizoctonia sp. CBS 109695]